MRFMKISMKVHRSEDDDGDHDVLQLSVNFVSLKEQALFYSDILDDDPTDYYDVEVSQTSQKI
jgi:hypothetical protein